LLKYTTLVEKRSSKLVMGAS